MKVYIATDWSGTKLFIGKPTLIYNNGEKEWFGCRSMALEYYLIPKNFKQERYELVEAEMTLTINN